MSSLQRWAWHPVDIWTVQMSTGCHVISAEMTWHPVDIWTVQMSTGCHAHLCRDAWHPVTNSSNCLQDDSCLSAEMSHPETFELFVTGCHVPLQRWVILRHLNCLLQDAMLSLCRDMSHPETFELFKCLQDAMLISLCRDESSWDIWTVCYRMPCSLSSEMSRPETFELFVTGCHVSLAEMSHPETFELFVTGCHALSLQRWVILRHLNCLLQDAMLSLFRDESSWYIWTVCYRMPCSLSL